MELTEYEETAEEGHPKLEEHGETNLVAQEPQRQKQRCQTNLDHQKKGELVVGLIEKIRQVVESRGQIEEKRIILGGIKIQVLLERGDRHPEEGEGQQRGKNRQHQCLDGIGPHTRAAKNMADLPGLQIPH